MGRDDYVELWLWHVFHSVEVDGQVDVQLLKLVTAHLGDSLSGENKVNMSQNVEKKYQCNSSLALCFTNYLEFLEEQGFLHNDNVNLFKLEERLWRLCLPKLEKRDQPQVGSPELRLLWQIFNFLAEPGHFPVSIDREEMELLMEKLVQAMGTRWDPARFEHTTKGLTTFTFAKTLTCFESVFARDVDTMCIADAVKEVYDEIILEVSKKGFLFKKGRMMKIWRERYFVLTPRSLTYYTDRDEKDKKGAISLNESWKTETIPDQKNYRHCFTVWTEAKKEEKTRYELSATDPRTRTAWMIALNDVFGRAQRGGQGQYGELLKRRELRKKRREEQEEEKEERQREREQREEEQKIKMKRLDDKRKEEIERRQREEEARQEAEEKLEMTQKRREEERLLREQQEEEERKRRLEEEEEQRRFKDERDKMERAFMEEKEMDQRRLTELQEALENLKMMLEEEKRLRAEEQEARELQQRLLQQEMEKRQRIEELKQQQAAILEEERQRREDLEVKSEEQTKETEMYMAILEEERVHLAKLEEQREMANEKLEAAMEKISEAEKKRAIIERRKEELSKKKTSLGLAQPVRPTPRVLLTHRLVVPVANLNGTNGNDAPPTDDDSQK